MVELVLKIVAGLAATYIFLRLLLHLTQDAQEPPALETAIPFLSPVIGMRKKGKFYMDLRYQRPLQPPHLHPPPPLPSPLHPQLHRPNPHCPEAHPVEARVAMNVMGASAEGRKVLVRERDGVKDYSYAIEYDKAIHPSVTPGPQLDEMSRMTVEKISKAVDALCEQGAWSLRLFDWVRSVVMTATTDTVYGSRNPFKDVEIQNAYCKFEPGIIALLLDLYPNIFARQSVQGREALVAAFHAYFLSGGHEQASSFVKAQHQHKLDQGVTGLDIARFELGAVVAILSNTVPAAFWVLFHALSNAAVLSDCRREILSCCTTTDTTCTLDMTRVKASCPILLSVFKEALRFHGIGTSVRMVTQDHLLDGKYLLKKGGILMIPGPVQHTSIAAYGADVDTFQHTRFVRSSERKRPDPVAFRGFGVGSTLCPGRHFATTEVLTFVALTIARADFEPVGGRWVCPTTDKASMAGTVAPPDEDVEVRVVGRDERCWNVVLSGSDEGVEVAVEDML